MRQSQRPQNGGLPNNTKNADAVVVAGFLSDM